MAWHGQGGFNSGNMCKVIKWGPRISKKNYCKFGVWAVSLDISIGVCFGSPREQSQRDGSFEYSQHMFGNISI